MVRKFTKEHISDVAEAQVLSWREAFQGILSDSLLTNLQVETFEANWINILRQEGRQNFIWTTPSNKAIGFISFGPPKKKQEDADFEIYGIYVHPNHWKQGIGNALLSFARKSIRQLNPTANIILWTMRKNKISHSFYLKNGFVLSGKSRNSQRNQEYFEEAQFICLQLTAPD